MTSVSPVNPNQIQMCPHGLPPGGCPMCNGMGGGSSGNKNANMKPENEMSYTEMYAIWMQIKAAQARKAEAKEAIQKQVEFAQNAKQLLQNITDKLVNVLNKIENMLPSPLNSLFAATINNILKPIMNIINNFPNFVNNVEKFLQNLQREVYIVAEKLASVFGEIKNFIQKKASDIFKKFTKKVYKILNLFGLETEEEFEDDEKAKAEIKAFRARDVKNLKKLMFKLIQRKRKEDPDDSDY